MIAALVVLGLAAVALAASAGDDAPEAPAGDDAPEAPAPLVEPLALDVRFAEIAKVDPATARDIFQKGLRGLCSYYGQSGGICFDAADELAAFLASTWQNITDPGAQARADLQTMQAADAARAEVRRWVGQDLAAAVDEAFAPLVEAAGFEGAVLVAREAGFPEGDFGPVGLQALFDLELERLIEEKPLPSVRKDWRRWERESVARHVEAAERLIGTTADLVAHAYVPSLAA